jgi:hypothetical protein
MEAKRRRKCIDPHRERVSMVLGEDVGMEDVKVLSKTTKKQNHGEFYSHEMLVGWMESNWKGLFSYILEFHTLICGWISSNLIFLSIWRE